MVLVGWPSERSVVPVTVARALGLPGQTVASTRSMRALRKRLQRYLSEQGASRATMTIEKATKPPQLDPRSGKFRQVYSEVMIGWAGHQVI